MDKDTLRAVSEQAARVADEFAHAARNAGRADEAEAKYQVSNAFTGFAQALKTLAGMQDLKVETNQLCAYCGSRWLLRTCWWQGCKTWTCGDYECRTAHMDAVDHREGQR